MAEIIPNEGLDYIVNLVLKAGTPPSTLYVGLFTGATASTTPTASAVLSTATGVTEAGYTGYARQSISSASWGTIGGQSGWSQSGRGSVGPQVSFPAATASYATQINGFFIATTLSSGGVALGYSNFDDSTGVATMAIGDIIKVTPTFFLTG
ncbi:MAG: hypothetical protein OJJ54_13540 [Pseudonocardia sp.]|nr:hypothetical protein [Pseudonocardia sp.]